MIPATKRTPPTSAWTWPALLGVSTVFALIVALVADGQRGLGWLCTLILICPVAVVARALWRR